MKTAIDYFPPYFGGYTKFVPGVTTLRELIVRDFGDLYEGADNPVVLDGVVIKKLPTSVGTCYLSVRGTDGVVYLVTHPSHRGDPRSECGRLELGFLHD